MRHRPRLVVDTNVFVSAILWKGVPGRLIAMAGERDIRLFISSVLLGELAQTLAKPKLARAVAATGLSIPEILASVRHLVTSVRVTPLAGPVSRDPDDDRVLACAVAARADLIVSGDKDLLVLGSYAGMPIVMPVHAMAIVEASKLEARP